MRWRAFITILTAAALAVLGGCSAPNVPRAEENARFKTYLIDLAKQVNIDPARPLTMGQCENLALANSLNLSVQNLTYRLQDDKVALSLVTGLPNFSLNYNEQERSNPNRVLTPTGTGSSVATTINNQYTRNLAVQAVLPVLDFGLTYYSYRMAVDGKKQEYLTIQRAEQLLRRDVRIAYTRHAGAIRQRQLADIAYQAAEQVLKSARSLEREQLSVPADTAQVEAAVAQAGLDLAQAKNSVRQTHLVLSQLMSLPPEVDFSIISDLPPLPSQPTEQDVKGWEERSLVARPELYVQDLERQIAASDVRRQASEFFPHLDLTASFNWSNLLGAVNPAFFLGGFQVTHSLLDSTASIWRYQMAQRETDVQKAQSLLVMLGVLYEVDFSALQVANAYETVQAAQVLDRSRRAALNRVISLYREGIESESGAARALADLTTQATLLDQSETEYFVAWHQLEAAVLPEEPLTQPATQPASQPTSQATSQAASQPTSLPVLQGVLP